MFFNKVNNTTLILEQQSDSWNLATSMRQGIHATSGRPQIDTEELIQGDALTFLLMLSIVGDNFLNDPSVFVDIQLQCSSFGTRYSPHQIDDFDKRDSIV